jgi:EAL domain-containing protein (putative c-di-GMP-specific phosphodiesterase class I)/CheY-like chemotaxis protein
MLLEMQMKKHILFVDDEPSILSAIRRTLRRSPYNILTADSPEKAIEIIGSMPISVLFSDYTMPGKTGAELLAVAKKIRPEMIRIILSGNGDQEATIESINQGSASRFITKPWDDGALTAEIDDAVAKWEASRYSDYQKGILNQAAFIDAVEELSTSGEIENLAAVYFGVQDFDRMQLRLGRDQVSEFLRSIAPESSARDMCLAFGLMNDNHYCAILPTDGNSKALEERVLSLIDQFPRTVEFDGQKYRVLMDIGYHTVSAGKENATLLIENALTACQHTKTAKMLKVASYDVSMDEKKDSLKNIENGLYDALSENEFDLYYQPKVNTLDGSLYGAEALIRWNHKQLGMVSPLDFIPLAEQGDTIIDIGNWVMGEAARQWVDWFGLSALNTAVSVNVSPVQLQDPTIVKRVESVLLETGIDPASFELEITETMMVENAQATIRVLNEIKELGVMLAIDDFGTGYSSLSQLKFLPVDTLKIDRSFISPMLESGQSRKLVRNLIKLGHDLGIEIVAEGVEDKKQLEILKGYGCDVIQGYYFGKPVPASDFAYFIEKFRAGQIDNGFRAAS